MCRSMVIFLGVPEGAIVDRVDRQVAVVAPAVTGPGLASRAGEQCCFALRQSIQWICRQTSRIPDLREYASSSTH